VTVGGMLTQLKKLRTKKGDPMMFVTLDDLEGSVEVLVFGKALLSADDALTPDSIVLVRGRVDHKDRDKTSIVAQQVERFAPSPDEIREAVELAAQRTLSPVALRLRLDASAVPATVLDELKEVLAGFPGDSEVVIELSTSVGDRRLRLGPEFRVTRSPGLHAELDALLGEAMLTEPDRAGERASVAAGGA